MNHYALRSSSLQVIDPTVLHNMRAQLTGRMDVMAETVPGYLQALISVDTFSALHHNRLIELWNRLQVR